MIAIQFVKNGAVNEMQVNKLSEVELVTFAAGACDESTAAQIAQYLETHPEDAALVARFQALCALVRYVVAEQPPEPLLARTRSLYRRSGYRIYNFAGSFPLARVPS